MGAKTTMWRRKEGKLGPGNWTRIRIEQIFVYVAALAYWPQEATSFQARVAVLPSSVLPKSAQRQNTNRIRWPFSWQPLRSTKSRAQMGPAPRFTADSRWSRVTWLPDLVQSHYHQRRPSSWYATNLCGRLFGFSQKILMQPGKIRKPQQSTV